MRQACQILIHLAIFYINFSWIKFAVSHWKSDGAGRTLFERPLSFATTGMAFALMFPEPKALLEQPRLVEDFWDYFGNSAATGQTSAQARQLWQEGAASPVRP
jgi:hypothetical protein